VKGRNESEAVRAALVEGGSRRGQASLADELRRLAAEPAERKAAMAGMDAVSAEWPE
jgi:hypothetical protein